MLYKREFYTLIFRKKSLPSEGGLPHPPTPLGRLAPSPRTSDNVPPSRFCPSKLKVFRRAWLLCKKHHYSNNPTTKNTLIIAHVALCMAREGTQSYNLYARASSSETYIYFRSQNIHLHTYTINAVPLYYLWYGTINDSILNKH